ncbi:MAG: hypothetical protein ACTSYD_09620 [Candidatus Heimdallarchaeaceae archaeon]
MKEMLYNKLKNLSLSQIVDSFKTDESYNKLLSKLQLDKKTRKEDFISLLLKEIKQNIKSEKRKEAFYLLKILKKLLPFSSVKQKVEYYLQLSDYFILGNDYKGAEKAAQKAKALVSKTSDPSLHIRVLNMLFVIARTLKNDNAIEFLLKSKRLAEEHKFYDNIVFCDVNIGLIHLFKKEYTKAAEYVMKVVSIVSTHQIPKEKMIMPADFFLHVFSESPGFVKVPKYRETILNGISIVLQAIEVMKDEYYAIRRLSVLIGILLISEELVDSATKIINKFIEKCSNSLKAAYYAAIASGFSDFKGYKMAIVYFKKAISYVRYTNEDRQREIRKKYAYILAKALNIQMIYDLQSSTNLTQKLKDISIQLESNTLIGKKGDKVRFANAVAEADAVFGIKRDFIEKKLFNSIKEMCHIVPSISEISHSKARGALIQSIEPIVISALDHENSLHSLLLVGSVLDEKSSRRKGKQFEGYQIIGHIVPTNKKQGKHWEEFDVEFLYELLTAPQKYKDIEILIVNDKADIDYKKIFSSK